jgi:hypothetical protein
MSELWMYHGASTIMRKTLDWNRSKMSMLEMEAVHRSFRKIDSGIRELIRRDTHRNFATAMN